MFTSSASTRDVIAQVDGKRAMPISGSQCFVCISEPHARAMLPVSELPANDIRLTGASVKRSPRRNQPSELILLGRSRSRKTGGIGLRVFQPAPGVVEDDPVVGLQKPRSQQLFERC